MDLGHMSVVRRHTPRIVGGLVALLMLLPMTSTHAETSDRQRVIVTFAPRTTGHEWADVLDDAGVRTSVDSVEFASESSLRDVPVAVMEVTARQRAALRADPDVRSVENDVPIRAARVVPPDPAWSAQEGTRSIDVDDAWDDSTGDDDVVIAIVDTGVDAGNDDLTGRILSGYDFVNADTDPRDDNGHGTAVATIAAAASNSYGIAGVCWHCRIMPIKVLDASGEGYVFDAARGIAWAVDHGADVINLSLGAASTTSALTTALDAAEHAGVVVVASAGNSGTTARNWPAADPRVIAVAALDGTRRANYSNYGDWVDVAAPGCNPAIGLDQLVFGFCGTSSSAPLVAGVLTLMKSVHTRAAVGELRPALLGSALYLGGGLGAGRADADAAIAAVPHAEPSPEPAPSSTPAPEPEPISTPEPAPSEEIAPPPSFTDIAGSVHRENIVTLAAAGITGGCTVDLYCPSRAVTRGQMATFLTRGLDLPERTATFDDVPADHPHAAGIGAVSATGITNGCTADLYCPSAPVTRAQMASFLVRALDL
jgi:subtilisin family serine protease